MLGAPSTAPARAAPACCSGLAGHAKGLRQPCGGRAGVGQALDGLRLRGPWRRRMPRALAVPLAHALGCGRMQIGPCRMERVSMEARHGADLKAKAETGTRPSRAIRIILASTTAWNERHVRATRGPVGAGARTRDFRTNFDKVARWTASRGLHDVASRTHQWNSRALCAARVHRPFGDRALDVLLFTRTLRHVTPPLVPCGEAARSNDPCARRGRTERTRHEPLALEAPSSDQRRAEPPA